jgi:uridine kinase
MRLLGAAEIAIFIFSAAAKENDADKNSPINRVINFNTRPFLLSFITSLIYHFIHKIPIEETSVYIISICGGSGSGKTTFTDKVRLVVKEEISVVHMDSYYLPKLPKELQTRNGQPNFDHPDAFDWKLLSSHLGALKKGKSVESPLYDFKKNSRLKKVKVIKPSKVVLFEGIFSLYDEEIRKLSDITAFLNVEADIRFIRRLHRDVEERGRSLDSVITQYYETVRPMYQKYLDPQRQFADFIVGEESDIAAGILGAKINELIGSNPKKSRAKT